MFEASTEQINAFRAATNRVYLGNTARGNTIGVQSERMLHLILKHYLVPDEICHEQKVGRHWADALVGHQIYEIQTRRMDRLRGKLAVMLNDYDVTVVYPIAASKKLSWIDPVGGTMTKPRKSTVKRTIYDIFYELFFIREYLTHPRFHFCALLCEMEEFRALTGYGKEKKRRAPRTERIPTALVGEAHFKTPADYACLIPKELGARFTTPELTRMTGMLPRVSWRAIQVLQSLGLIREVGKVRNAKLWERVERSEVASHV